MDVLTFTLDQARCAIPIGDVVEIVRSVAVSSLPGAPPVIEGVINLRGTIVPVLDTRRAMWDRASAPRLDDQFIVVLSRARYTAIRVDHAHEIVRVDRASIDDTASQVTIAPMVSGVAALPDGLILIHDVQRFLTDAEAASLTAALVSHDADGAHLSGRIPS